MQALVFSTPEWRARAAEVARGKSPLGDDQPALGLACADEFEPAHCQLNDPTCQLRCDAIRVCSNCAGGRWLTLTLGPAKQTLYIEDDPSAPGTGARRLPYGEWRNQFRMRARRERAPESRALADARQSFPDHHAGDGELGYGKPAHTSIAPSAPVRSILKQGGFELVREEQYGPLRFPVFVVAGKQVLPQTAWRAWGAELVRAAGNRSCELVSGAERYQFDRFAAEDTQGGVYVFIENAFHPWLPREE